MTDLTDKWKKGELPEGFYYFKLPNGETMVGSDYCLATYLLTTHSDRCEVLGELPSYEEWQAKLEENARLKKQINHVLRTQARQFVDNQKLQVKAEKAKDVVNIDTARQIKQLKELLKECRNILNEQTFHRNTCLETDETLRNRIVKKAEILQKIDEALK